MKISVVSDLHLECGYQELPGGEVLLLVGDIAESRTLKREFHSTKSVDRKPGIFPCSDFFEYECAKYEKVFMVMGNHEHYYGRFYNTYLDILSILPDNVTLLEDQYEEYNGVIFLGSTLWTDCNKLDPITINQLKYSMNDYRCVTMHDEAKNVYHKLTPEYTANVHYKTKEFFKTVLDEHQNKPVVVMTHHAPSTASIHEKYKHDYYMNGGYASEMSDMILDNPQIKYWFHGHMHDPVDYMVGSTRVMSNPRGYFGFEDTDQFKPDFHIEI